MFDRASELGYNECYTEIYMCPALLAITGPNQGKIFKLTEKESSIGRDSSNWLCIPDVAASRRHCLIRKGLEKFVLVDLDSHNGTFVNDIPAGTRILRHGDQIRIANSLFIFLIEELEKAQIAGQLQPASEQYAAKSTVELRTSESMYLNADRIQTKLPASERLSQGLNTLLKISTAIHLITDEKTLALKLVELILQAVPAERCTILAGENTEELTVIYSYDKTKGSPEHVQISYTIVARALQENVAILSNDVQQNDNFLTKSLSTAKITSLLAVPIVTSTEKLGVIYLDTGDSRVGFDEDHLQLASAIASISAVAFKNLRYISSLKIENRNLQNGIEVHRNMIGESKNMLEVYEFITRVAPTNATILIYGESGTGKELVAEAIHQNSPRAGKPFIIVNCAAIAESLLESELFGHEKGAFTGAIAQKKGKLEVADGGTVFLDEIGELPVTLQAKLLRVLQQREFDRLGGTRTIKVDVRFIAATNKNLENEIAKGSFRSDLLYRLNVISLTMPPLRERREDIPLLATYFVAKYGSECKRRPMGLSAEVRTCLVSYDWPGNVRELQNAIERAVVMATHDVILPEDLPEAILEGSSVSETHVLTRYHETLRETKKQLVLKAFEQAGGSHVEAARLLGVHPQNLYRLIRTLNLKSLVG